MARSFRPLDLYYWRKQCERGVENCIVYQVHLNNLYAPYIRRYSEGWYIEVHSTEISNVASRYRIKYEYLSTSIEVRVFNYQYIARWYWIEFQNNIMLLCVTLRQTGHSSTNKFFLSHLSHFSPLGTVECSRMHSNAVECTRMRSNAVKCSRMRSNAVECSQMQSNAVECSRMQRNAVECT